MYPDLINRIHSFSKVLKIPPNHYYSITNVGLDGSGTMVLNSQRRDKSLRNSFENRTSRGTKREKLSFLSFLFLRIEVARANSDLYVWLVYWVSANKLAIPNKLTTGYALSRHTTYIHTAAVLTLICGCTNKVMFIARPCGLRYKVFVRVLRTSTPALGTKREKLSFLSFFLFLRIEVASANKSHYLRTLEIDVTPYLCGFERPPRIETKAS